MYANGKYYAGTYNYDIYYSTTGTSGWEQITDTDISGRTVHSLMYANGKYYAGTNNYGIYWSSDDGATWTAATGTGISGKAVYALMYANGKYYAGTNNYGIYYSNNGTSDWAQITGTTISGKTVNALMYANGKYYAGTDSGVYYSTTGTSGWQQITGTTISNQLVYSLMYANGKYYAGTISYGIYATKNISSYALTPTLGPNTNITVNDLIYVDPNTYLAGGSNELLCSTDGVEWKQAELNKYVRSLMYANDKYYAGTNDSGIYYSTTGTSDWEQITDTTISNKTVYSLMYANDKYYIGTGGGIYYSNNDTSDWEQITGMSNKIVYSLMYANDKYYAGTYGYGIYWSSDDDDATWTAATGDISGKTVNALLYLDGNYVKNSQIKRYYAGTTGYGLHYSDTGTENWAQITGLPKSISVNKLEYDGTTIFAATSGGLYTSIDGETWALS